MNLYLSKGPLAGRGPCAVHTLHTSRYGPVNETLLTLSSRSLYSNKNNNNSNKVSFNNNNNEVANNNNNNVVAQRSVCMLPQFATPRRITGLPVAN